MSGKILRKFVSEIDKLIQHFDKEHPELSKSQRKEIAKHDRVQFLRDNDNPPASPPDFESLL